MLTELQTRGAQAIVVVFETGDPRGDYGAVTVIPGDTGHLTYGRLQATLGSGNLHALIQRYCEAPGARHATALTAFLDRLKQGDVRLDHDAALRAVLEEAGEDPVMHRIQDRFFDEGHWARSRQAADRSGIASPLGASIVFDGFIQGAWAAMRDRTIERFGAVAALGEQTWLAHYVDVRREWLATHERSDLRPTVYRMDAYRALVGQTNWQLALPFSVRGAEIDERLLRTGTRTLRQGCKGDDVRALQRALARAGVAVKVDGDFGQRTATALRGFQQQRGLVASGMGDDATRAALQLA